MTKKLKKNLKRIIISLSLFIILMITDVILEHYFSNLFPKGIASIIPFSYGWILNFILFLIIYIYIGHDVLRKSFINIKHGQVFDENFLMSVATLGAFCLGIYTGIKEGKPVGFDEGCAVLLFYQVGEWFQAYAVGKSRKSISELMDIRPEYANLFKDGEVIVVSPEEVKPGDIIYIKPGERIPLDGIIIKGTSTLDTKALTGESLPKEVEENDYVISGEVNLTKTLEVKVTTEYANSTVAKILDLVENASNQKSKSENFIAKFAKYYTPIVVILALCLCVIPPVINLILSKPLEFNIWIYRALSFLVVSCPCALVISIPLSFFAGIGGASRNGILIKGSIHLERFNKVTTFVFDKTGTLTKGNFKVTKIYPEENREQILSYACIAEASSNHPIALSIKEYHQMPIDSSYSLEDIPGKGIKATKDDEILCGNEKLMNLYNIDIPQVQEVGTIVYVALNKKFLGYIVITDEIKPEAKTLIAYLNKIKAKSIMLTGDNEQIASLVASSLQLTDYKSSLLPQDKVKVVDELLKNNRDNELLAFVGDGINDAPVLMKSDVGLAMGGVGSDAAIEASDIVLMNDNLTGIIKAKKLAKLTMSIVKQNIIIAIGVKVLIMILSSIGITNMWFAVFGDVGVAVIAIINAMRANRKKL